MNNARIRLVVILATLSMVGVAITQFYWVRKAFDLKEAEFDRTVNTALLNVAHTIFDINNTPPPANNPVEQISTNYFVVNVNSDIDANLLEFLLHTEFEKRSIKADFEYGIYDCANEKMVYGDYVSLGQGVDQQTKKELPLLSSQGYYFGVQFPNQRAQILNQMGIWTFSSVVLIVVLLFFGYTLFVILKQKRLSEIQRDFINNMTHEFKTPLATISVSTEVLKDPSIINNPERLHNYTSIIEKESTRLRHHVDRVLQLASSTKDDITLNKEKIDIHNLIEEVAEDFELMIQSKNGKFGKEFSATTTLVNGDLLHLQNAFHNLFDNAIKYSKDTPIIKILTENTKKRISISISDNGIGIAKENQSRVFENFYRVPTGNVHDVKGFGIGLSYVKTIVASHHGTITLKSELGKGSTFTLTFPTV